MNVRGHPADKAEVESLRAKRRPPRGLGNGSEGLDAALLAAEAVAAMIDGIHSPTHPRGDGGG